MADLAVATAFFSLLAIFYWSFPKIRCPSPVVRSSPTIGTLILIANICIPKLYSIGRADGLALLNQGLTGSNLVNVAITLIGAAYIVFLLWTRKLSILNMLDERFLPIFVMIAVFAASTLWSRYPSYTGYRALELAVYITLIIHIFNNARTIQQIYKIVMAVIFCWLMVSMPTLISNVSSGIIFSAAKDNLFPVVCMLIFFIPSGVKIRGAKTLSAIGFVASGSAASAALIFPAVMSRLFFSRSGIVRYVSVIGFVLIIGIVVTYLLDPSRYRFVIGIISDVLQKPEQELLRATGRFSIWQVVWEASRNSLLGFGFATERFLQTIASYSMIANLWGTSQVNLASAHNGYLSAWFGAGWLGIISLVFLYFQTFSVVARGVVKYRAGAFSYLMLLALNSNFVPGIGSVYSVYWIGWIACVFLATKDFDKEKC